MKYFLIGLCIQQIYFKTLTFTKFDRNLYLKILDQDLLLCILNLNKFIVRFKMKTRFNYRYIQQLCFIVVSNKQHGLPTL